MDTPYQTLLQSTLTVREYWFVNLLVHLLQSLKDVKLEQLAQNLPLPILMESRRRKLQRFLCLQHWTVENIWWPILLNWLERTVTHDRRLYLALDRTQWCDTNLIMLSVIYRNRAVPVQFQLLDKLGNSNYDEQISFLGPVLALLKDYTLVFLGDREFCGVDLAKWLEQRHVFLAVRLKKNEYIELADQWETPLSELGIQPGKRQWFEQVKVTKTKGFGPINVAARHKRNYGSHVTKETWYIMSNLTEIEDVLTAYSYRMGIEQMFRDWKKGGYNMEDTKLSGQRFIGMMLLVCLAYYRAILRGEKIQHQNIQQYVARPKEKGRKHRRHSAFAIGISAEALSFFGVSIWDLISQYMNLDSAKFVEDTSCQLQ